MTTRLSDDLRQAVKERGGAPVYLVDSATNATYVLMRAEQFERLRSVLDADDIEAMYPLLADIDCHDRHP